MSRLISPVGVATSLATLAAAAAVSLAFAPSAPPEPAAAATAAQDGALARAASFGEHPLWDDGKAELSRYAAEEIVEGEKRKFTAWSVIVAEHFDPKAMVKADEWSAATIPVLKCNWFLNIPTGVYSYQQMASLFLRRADGLVMKAAFSNQEWCGMTFAQWRRDQDGLAIHSYWQGEGDQRYAMPELATNTLFHEQLPLWIRGRAPTKVRTEPITLIRKRIGSAKCPPPKLVAAAIWFDGVKEDATGPRIEARLLVDKQVDTFLFAPDFPHVLQEWRRDDGTTWKLEKSDRLDYWKFSKNEFAELLK